MSARYYDTNVGRFVNESPLGFGGWDVNLYAYVAGNPINGIDPSGKFIFLLAAPAAYTGAMALADLAVIGATGWMISSSIKDTPGKIFVDPYGNAIAGTPRGNDWQIA